MLYRMPENEMRSIAAFKIVMLKLNAVSVNCLHVHRDTISVAKKPGGNEEPDAV